MTGDDDEGEAPSMIGTITDLSGKPGKVRKREFPPGFAIVAAPSTELRNRVKRMKAQP